MRKSEIDELSPLAVDREQVSISKAVFVKVAVYESRKWEKAESRRNNTRLKTGRK